MFKPHESSTRFVGMPEILITQQALRDMWHFASSSAPRECCWWTTVLYEKPNRFIIDGIYTGHHAAASGAYTELSESGYDAMIRQLMEEDIAAGITDADKLRVNRLRGWFHSHVNMQTNASLPDKEQTASIRETSTSFEYLIRGIVNLNGRIQLNFYDLRSFVPHTRIEDIPWAVYDDSTRAEDSEERRTWEKRVRELLPDIKGSTRDHRADHPAQLTNSFGGQWTPDASRFAGWVRDA